ncbi:MAG: hypothetical protein ACJ75B_06205 [Flavisolibacter sp.]
MKAFIVSLPSWIIFICTLLVGMGVVSLGVWFTRYRMKRLGKENVGSLGFILGALLSLLSFLLGLTYSITQSRYAERKHLVVEQAKIIETCYLRTSLLPDSQKLESQRILSNYVDLLVGANSLAGIEKKISQLDTLHLHLWYQASSLTLTHMDPELRALYVGSVNDVLNIFGERKTVAFVFRIPAAIWIVLVLLYISSMFILGSEIDPHKIRYTFHVPILAACFALVITLIGDMDSTTKTSNFIVTQQPLMDVQNLIRAEKTLSYLPQN